MDWDEVKAAKERLRHESWWQKRAHRSQPFEPECVECGNPWPCEAGSIATVLAALDDAQAQLAEWKVIYQSQRDFADLAVQHHNDAIRELREAQAAVAEAWDMLPDLSPGRYAKWCDLPAVKAAMGGQR